MEKKLLIFACLLSFFGCRQVSVNSETTEDTSVNASVMHIKIEGFDGNTVLRYSDVFESVRFIKLETTNSCLIGNIDKIIATKDKFVIMDTSSAKTVLVFDQDGKFLNIIGTNGAGPEEYDHPSDIAYDKYEDELLVLCYSRRTILRFKLDGSFKGKITLEHKFNSMFVTSENTCIVYFNNNTQSNGKKNDHNIAIINKEGDIIEHLLPYDANVGKLSPPRPIFSTFENQVIFSPYFFNTVYSLNESEITSKYYLDFGTRGIPRSVYKDKSLPELMKIINNGDYAYNIASFETSSHIISQFIYKRQLFDCFYSKETGNTKIAAVYLNDMLNVSTGRRNFFPFGDSLISCVEPETMASFKELIKKMKDEKKELNDVLYSHLFPSASPIIVDKKLKDNYMSLLESTKISLSEEEIDFINSIDEMDNPILLIAKPKKI